MSMSHPDGAFVVTSVFLNRELEIIFGTISTNNKPAQFHLHLEYKMLQCMNS